MSADELEGALRKVGAERYHNLHPFHRRMRDGECGRDEIAAWALNRYYYQSQIPIKDATIIARMQDPALRREWRRRIIDHDGNSDADRDGGIARWLALTDAMGFSREEVTSLRLILPATRFAVDAYVNFCARHSLLEAIASSLTELFSPQIIGERTAGMLAHYDFITKDTLAYFTERPPQAQRDSDFTLAYVREKAVTPEAQQAVIAALEFKTGVLWAQLDALWHAYVEGHIPPGAWKPAA
jgi:coenzyme PQQ biosynthesis protein C